MHTFKFARSTFNPDIISLGIDNDSIRVTIEGKTTEITQESENALQQLFEGFNDNKLETQFTNQGWRYVYQNLKPADLVTILQRMQERTSNDQAKETLSKLILARQPRKNVNVANAAGKPAAKKVDSSQEKNILTSNFKKELTKFSNNTSSKTNTITIPQTKKIKGFIKQGADITLEGAQGVNVAHVAAVTGDISILEDISKSKSIEIKKIINKKNTEGNCPLHCASNLAIAEELVKHGANPEKKNKAGQTPLQYWQTKNPSLQEEWEKARLNSRSQIRPLIPLIPNSAPRPILTSEKATTSQSAEFQHPTSFFSQSNFGTNTANKESSERNTLETKDLPSGGKTNDQTSVPFNPDTKTVPKSQELSKITKERSIIEENNETPPTLASLKLEAVCMIAALALMGITLIVLALLGIIPSLAVIAGVGSLFAAAVVSAQTHTPPQNQETEVSSLYLGRMI